MEMAISLFLAKALGLYMVIVGVAMFVNQKLYKVWFDEASRNPAFMFINGLLALIIGILLVVSHNVWHFDWRLVITVMAWMALLKGIFITAFPQPALKFYGKFAKKKAHAKISYVVTFLLGVYLCYWGFEINPLTGLVQ
jgi:hypothetical protein